ARLRSPARVTSQIHTPSLHDALPIYSAKPSISPSTKYWACLAHDSVAPAKIRTLCFSFTMVSSSSGVILAIWAKVVMPSALRARSEEHTSELQSRENLVCRLRLGKTK